MNISLNDEINKKLICELRNEFHIPPYCDDETLNNYIKEGAYELSRYVSNIDYVCDITACMLIKNYAFYAYNNITHIFHENYEKTLLSWQMSKIGGDENDESTSL